MAVNAYISICDGKNAYRRISRNGWRAFYASIIGLFLLALLTVHPLPFYDGEATATPGTANPSTSSITLSSSTSSTSVNLTPGAGFTLSTATNTSSYDVTTDNISGYTIKLTAADDAQTLVNVADNTKTLSSITSPIEQTNFIKTNPSLVNRWGIKPNKYYDATSSTTIDNTTTILPAPTTSGTILDVTSTANPTTANNYSIALGAMVDGNKSSGTYIRETTLVVVPNPVNYVINYNKNTTDTVANLPSAQSSSTTATSIKLSTNIPTRASYGFLGYCLGTPVTTAGVDSCTDGSGGAGTIFQPGDDFGIDQTTTNVSTLYAMWSANSYVITYGTVTGIDSVSLDGTACTTALPTGCTKTLTYGQTYNLVATVSTGYSFTSWDPGSYGTIANTGSTGATTTYTVGAGNSTIAPTTTINTYKLTLTFSGSGISSVKVCKVAGDCSGTNLVGTVTTSGGIVSNLTYNQSYYLYPTITGTNSVSSWARTAGVGTLSSTTADNPTFTIGAGDGTVRLTSAPTSFTKAYQKANKSTTTYSGTAYYTMQDMSSTICANVAEGQTGTLLDNRLARLNDNSTKHYYNVVKYQGKCWMTQNLTYAYNASNTTSTTSYSFNITGANVSNKTLAFYNLNSTEGSSGSGHCYGSYNGSTGSGGGYSYACTWYGTNDELSAPTVWYNYAAASAGTVTGDSNSTAASQDICPTNWKMPSMAEAALLVNDDDTTDRSGYDAFKPVSGGYYRNGAYNGGGGGWWWLTDVYAAAARRQIGYGKGNTRVGIGADRRIDGIYVRCIAK